VPEGVVDVIPVDLVVAATIAVAARGPAHDDGRPDVTQVASGGVNPLRYRRLVDLVQGYFTAHPIYDRDGAPIVVPEWTFPGRGRVQRQLETAQQLMDRAEKLLHALPLRGKQAELSAKLEERRTDVDRAATYVELYGAYVECEAVYGVERLLALFESLTPDDRDAFGFDPRVVDWDRYATEIHLPSVVEHSRVRTTPGGSTKEHREHRLRRQVLDPARHVAAFDLENTLIASNVVTSYAWLATRRLPWDDRLRFVARTLGEAPRLLAMDRKDRGDFLRHFYRRYEDASMLQLAEDSVELSNDLLLAKAFPAAIRRVREHRALGHRTLLITGALDFVVDPLRPLFDDIVCASLSVRADGTYSGELTDVPPTGESRAQALYDYCDAQGFDARECVAYADSSSDLPLLDAAGYPVAVNPETKLAAIARSRGWLVEHWDKASGALPRLPLAPPRPSSLRHLGSVLP
jgi:HAD superfamily hydrolase (TIGR01490 family)